MAANKWLFLGGGFVAGLVVGIVVMSGSVPTGGTGGGAPAPVTQGQAGPDRVKLARDIEQLESILKQDPQNYGALVQLGNDYFDMGEPQKSVDAYRRALAIRGEDANVWADMGTMYRQMGDFPEAIASYRKGIEADPRHPNSRLNLGIVLFHDLNDRKGAIEAWEGFLSVEPAGPRSDQIRQSVEELKRQVGGESAMDQAARELGDQLKQLPEPE